MAGSSGRMVGIPLTLGSHLTHATHRPPNLLLWLTWTEWHSTNPSETSTFFHAKHESLLFQQRLESGSTAPTMQARTDVADISTSVIVILLVLPTLSEGTPRRDSVGMSWGFVLDTVPARC